MIPGNLGGKFEIFDVKSDNIESGHQKNWKTKVASTLDPMKSPLTSKISNFPLKFPGIVVIRDT